MYNQVSLFTQATRDTKKAAVPVPLAYCAASFSILSSGSAAF